MTIQDNRGNALARRPPKRETSSDEFLARQVSERLVLTRHALGYTQEEMAQMSGLGTRSAWANYEKGYRLIPLLTVYRLCVATGLTADWVIRGQITGLPPEPADKIQKEIARQSRKPPRN
jgi:transcriptional regulator with XRE-family HTH domain